MVLYWIHSAGRAVFGAILQSYQLIARCRMHDIRKSVPCNTFPCTDINTDGFLTRPVLVDPTAVRMVLVSESAPARAEDDYYAGDSALFANTTLTAFADAGLQAGSIMDLVKMGIYFTPAVKCAKTGYGIETATIHECSHLLEAELNLLPALKVIMLMGDVAIKSLNQIARRNHEARVIPAGSTYKIRGGQFSWRGVRVFPSYLQAGPSFNIEKSKRRMIVEDLAAGMRLAGII